MSGYGYSSDEDVNIRFTRRRGASPPPREYGYAEPATRQRPVSYFPVERPYLAPERTMIRTRSRSRERYRQSPPASPPAPAPAPVIIHNQIYNDQDSDDDYRGKLQVARPRRERSRSRGDDDRNYMTREQYEMERTRQQLEEMRLANVRDRDDSRAKGYRTDADLRNAKRELDQIKAEAERAKEQERIKKEIELERVKEEAREAEEKEQREKEAALAIEKYKAEEAERKAQEKKAKELAEKEYQRRLQEQLISSGLDEKQIEAILKKEKIKKEAPKPAPAPAPAPAPMPVQGHELARPTYTRMSRRHLSIETLRVYHVDFDYDQDPEYILIKRWVPEWEQNNFWIHTRDLREKRSSGGRLVVDVDDRRERRRSGGDPKFEWVRKKESGSRKRSKSPALLMYLAGAKPA